MQLLCALVLAAATATPGSSAPQLSAPDAVRVAEFYRLSAQIQDTLWPGWDKTPAPLLLITPKTEYLTHWTQASPDGFVTAGDGLLAHQTTLPLSFSAAMPLFGPPSVMVVGEPENTQSKTSTPWLIAVMHEHFHQLQNAQPGYYQAVTALGLSRGDNTGMWMINYPFPYQKAKIAHGFAGLRDLLLKTLDAADDGAFKTLAAQYIGARKEFFAQLAPDDRKYLDFQLWQEGMARYTQVKAAEAAANYQPSAAFQALPDYEPFGKFASQARTQTLAELRHIDLATDQRTSVYSFGAAEGFLLDRLKPNWKNEYFSHLLTTEPLFD